MRIARNDIKRQFKQESLKTVSQQLEQRLNEIKNFAERHNLNYFGKCFENGLQCLNSSNPLESIYHKDLLPSSVQNKEVLQILCSCQAAWVFGGMGSWNDMGFDGEEQNIYEKVSDDLYVTICKAIPIAVNSILKN